LPENRAILSPMGEGTGALIAKLLLQNLLWIAGMGALLCLAAGTLHWPAMWVFLATVAISGVAGGLWLARTDPALLAERMRPVVQADQPAADKAFMPVFGGISLLWFVAMGPDRRVQASFLPPALQVLGLAMLLASTGFILWVMRENSFAAHAIRHQLCLDCGVDVFARGEKPDGTDVIALNVACIDGIELSKLTMTPIDGRNR
jgi:hypothetical protein